MMIYKQYFVGGPLDGQDKMDTHPDHPEWEAIVIDDSLNGVEIHVAESNTPIHVMDVVWNYHLHTVRLGSDIVLYWTDGRYVSKEMAALRFWDLILKPHRRTVELVKANATKEGD